MRVAVLVRDAALLDNYPPFLWKLSEKVELKLYTMGGYSRTAPRQVEQARIAARSPLEAALIFVERARRECDLLYLFDGPLYELAALAACARGVPYVLRLRTPTVKLRRLLGYRGLKLYGYELVHAQAIRCSRAVSAISRELYREASELGAREVKLIYHGVDHEVFKPCPKTEAPTLVYPGGRRPEKLGKLVCTLARLVKTCTIECMGGFEACREDNIRPLGFLDRSELPKVYCRAWLGLHPSLLEGAPDAILEMTACGTPVVATDAGDSAMYAGPAGVVVPLGARLLERYYEAVVKLLRDEDELRYRSALARKWSFRFTWDKYAELTRELLELALRR